MLPTIIIIIVVVIIIMDITSYSSFDGAASL